MTVAQDKKPETVAAEDKSECEEQTGKVILFTVSPGLSKQDRENVLYNISTLSGIFAIAAVHPEAATEKRRNEYYATVDEKADFDSLIDEMRNCSGVYNTWMPPQLS